MSNVELHPHLLRRVEQREGISKKHSQIEFIRLELTRLFILEKSGDIKHKYSKEGKYVIQDRRTKIVYYKDGRGTYIILTYIRK